MKYIQYVPQYNASTLDPLKSVAWILKQPLKHFDIPVSEHSERLHQVIRQCKIDDHLLNKSKPLKWRPISTFMDS